MQEKYKKLIERLKNYTHSEWDDNRYETVEFSIQETQDAAKALEELSAAYDELEKKYTTLNFKYAVLNSGMNK